MALKVLGADQSLNGNAPSQKMSPFYCTENRGQSCGSKGISRYTASMSTFAINIPGSQDANVLATKSMVIHDIEEIRRLIPSSMQHPEGKDKSIIRFHLSWVWPLGTTPKPTDVKACGGRGLMRCLALVSFQRCSSNTAACTSTESMFCQAKISM